jgi:autotransporter-associated beta strand protein
MTGTTTVTAGQFTLASANLLADTSAVVINGGLLSLGGNDTIGSVAGSGGTLAIGSNTLTVSQSGTTSFAGAITGNGTLTKAGSGILTLTGNASAYAGATQVQAGTLAVNGSLGGSVDVSLGAILSGTGTIGGNASIAGTLNPGGAGAVGTQTFNGNLTYAAGSILSWELFANNALGGSYDQIAVPTGNMTFSGSTAIAMSFNAAGSAVAWSNSFWNVSRSWLVQDLGSGVINNFGNLSISTQNWLDSTGAAFNTARPGASFTVTQQGQDVLITYVPEPSTVVALIGGLAGVAGFSIRRRRGC